jgi:predicted signal transduction protein with EAL and GGDEF domain
MTTDVPNLTRRPDLKSSKTMCLWPLTGALVGYFMIHPWVMITAHLMFRPRLKSYFSNVDVIFAEFSRAFSLEMLPWALTFAVISSFTAAFYGRSRQAMAALRASEQRFKEMSITDELTGLHNSRHFFKQIKAEVERTDRYGHPLTLLILDLDNFKQYNDTFGHLAGEKVSALIKRADRNMYEAKNAGKNRICGVK